MMIRHSEMPGLLILVLGIFCCLFSATLIPADNPNINYFGRFDMSTPSAPKFNWSGAVIEAAFPGPYIGFRLSDGYADYDIEIDGKPDTIIRTKSGVTQYTIATDLLETSHIIRIIKRSESQWNTSVFEGLYLADGKSLLSAPAKPERKIEFIGDSYTVGYGNEYYAPDPQNRGCDQQQLRSYTNTNRSFPMLITKAFHAQSVILGWSGKGMVRNYGDAAKKSDSAYAAYYGRTLCAASDENWDFTKWVPDLVVICLCTNDYSTTNAIPDDTMFINAYHSFISRVLGNYPGASILCVGTNTGPGNAYIKRVVTEETSSLGHTKVYLDSFPADISKMGCDWHPTGGDDSAVAKVLIESIMKQVGWDTAASTAIEGRERLIRKTKHQCSFRISGNIATVYGSPDIAVGTRITVADLRGRTLVEGCLNTRRAFTWDLSGTCGGMYLVGIGKIGWRIVTVR